jgi:hypothetical protein
MFRKKFSAEQGITNCGTKHDGDRRNAETLHSFASTVYGKPEENGHGMAMMLCLTKPAKAITRTGPTYPRSFDLAIKNHRKPKAMIASRGVAARSFRRRA